MGSLLRRLLRRTLYVLLSLAGMLVIAYLVRPKAESLPPQDTATPTLVANRSILDSRHSPGAPGPATHAGSDAALTKTHLPSASPASETIIETLSTLSGSERTTFLREQATLLAEHDEEALTPLLQQLSSLRDRHAVVTGAVDTMLASNPQGASHWATSLPKGSSRDLALEHLGKRWAAADLDASLDWILSLNEDPEAQASALEGAVWTWTQADPGAVYTFLSEMENRGVAQQATRKAIKLLANTDPESATAWAMETEPDGSQYDLITYTVSRWAGRDYENARAWVESLTEAEPQHHAAQALVGSWSLNDPESATVWMAENGGWEHHQSTLLQASRRWAEHDPAQAAQWLSSLEGEPQHRVMENITRTLTNRSAEAAQNWIDQFPEGALKERGELVMRHNQSLGLASPDLVVDSTSPQTADGDPNHGS